MPKTKTSSSAKKRFKVTAGGKTFRRRAMKSHNLTKKTSKRKRNLRREGLIATNGEQKRIKRLIQAA